MSRNEGLIISFDEITGKITLNHIFAVSMFCFCYDIKIQTDGVCSKSFRHPIF